jgi:hypothetical protein
MIILEGKNIDGRHPIILDFIDSSSDLDGCGYFKGDVEAIKFAQTVGKNQKFKFKKHGIVPKALVKMMAQYWNFKKNNNPIYRNVTYDEFLTLLIRSPYKSEAGRQIGEKFYRDLLTRDMPWIEKSFAMAESEQSFKLTHEDIINLGLHIQSMSQQHLWERLELYGNYKKKNS